MTGAASPVGSTPATTAGPWGVGVEALANNPPRPGVIASEVEVPVTVWKTAVLTAAAPMRDTPATATRRRRDPDPSSVAVRRTHAAAAARGSTNKPPTPAVAGVAPADAVLGSTQCLLLLRRTCSPTGHDTRTPALVRAPCNKSNGRTV